MTRMHTSLGVGLIEVLIALVIIAVGLLGLLSLESRANQAELESYQRAQALNLVMDMVNRIKANSPFVACYQTNNAFFGTGVTFAATGCNTVSDGDLTSWNSALQGTSTSGNVGAMIGARGCITVSPNAGANQSTPVTVAVSWQGLSATVIPADSCAAGQYGSADAMRRTVAYSFAVPYLN